MGLYSHVILVKVEIVIITNSLHNFKYYRGYLKYIAIDFNFEARNKIISTAY